MFKIKTKPRNLTRYADYYRKQHQKEELFNVIGMIIYIVVFVVLVINNFSYE